METKNQVGIETQQQAVEVNKARMRERIEAASEHFPLTRLFLENKTFPSGLNLEDYVEVQRFPNAARIDFVEDHISVDIAKRLGDVTLGEQKIVTVGDLWNKFL